jgi:exosome complex protein LRP1
VRNLKAKMDFDFGELKNDVSFVTKVQTAAEAIQKIEQAIEDASQVKIEDLSTEDKVKHDIFMAYAVNSLYWMYLKINGDNPNTVMRNTK